MNFSETVTPYYAFGGCSFPTDLALIRALLRRYPVENYLEIETWRSESFANAAPLVKKAYTVNLPDEIIRSNPQMEGVFGSTEAVF